MSNWLERYQAGDCVQVWTEMVQHGGDLRGSAAWDDATAVAHVTMQRVRNNIERLVDLLPRHGYEFSAPDGAPPFVPSEVDAAALDRLDEQAGPLPLALRCWFEDVGQVNLIGRHPGWTFEYGDPLVLDSTVAFLTDEHRQWEEDRGTEWARGSFVLDLAPDYLHKANVSGGAPYGMVVPNAGVDGLFLGERHQTTLVNYLRVTMRWAGFPGWARGALDGWAAPAEPVPGWLSEVASQLLPF